MKSKQEVSRKRVYEFYLANRSQGKKITVDHFKAEKIPTRTIYSIIQRAESETGHERVAGTGRVAKIMTKSNVKRLKTMFNHRDGVSQRQAARKFNCSQAHISKTLASKTNIRVRKKRTIPLRTERQQERIRLCCDRLYRKLEGKSCILDDESYFTLAHSSLNGNANFYTSDVTRTPASIKYQQKAKFASKLLVWICISDKGMSEPYLVPSGLAINQKIYLEQCIKKRLMPFIEEHHSDGEYLFWPDLASSHYAKSVIEFLDGESIHFVAKVDNPPNVPECRPIEKFWSILKGKVYENNWQAKNIEQLRKRIMKSIAELDMELVKDLARSTRLEVGKIRTNDVIEKNLL